MFVALCTALWVCTCSTICKTGIDRVAYAVELAIIGGILQTVVAPAI